MIPTTTSQQFKSHTHIKIYTNNKQLV